MIHSQGKLKEIPCSGIFCSCLFWGSVRGLVGIKSEISVHSLFVSDIQQWLNLVGFILQCSHIFLIPTGLNFFYSSSEVNRQFHTLQRSNRKELLRSVAHKWNMWLNQCKIKSNYPHQTCDEKWKCETCLKWESDFMMDKVNFIIQHCDQTLF